MTEKLGKQNQNLKKKEGKQNLTMIPAAHNMINTYTLA